MAVDDALRWDERYARSAITEPAPPDALVAAGLESAVPEQGVALDIACGAGAQSVWLARRGLEVTAIDVSAAATRLTAAAAHQAGCADRVHTRVVDLDDGLPSNPVRFDIIVCQRFRDSALYGPIVDRLTPDGLAVVTVLSATGTDAPGPFHAPPGELAAAFDRPDVDLMFHREADGEESIVVRRRRS